MATACDGVAGLRAVDVEPSTALLARAAGDPEQVAAYVARHRYRNTSADVA